MVKIKTRRLIKYNFFIKNKIKQTFLTDNDDNFIFNKKVTVNKKFIFWFLFLPSTC